MGQLKVAALHPKDDICGLVRWLSMLLDMERFVNNGTRFLGLESLLEHDRDDAPRCSRCAEFKFSYVFYISD